METKVQVKATGRIGHIIGHALGDWLWVEFEDGRVSIYAPSELRPLWECNHGK